MNGTDDIVSNVVTFGFSRKITKTTGNETKLIRTKDKHARGRGIPASLRPFRRETRKIELTNQMDGRTRGERGAFEPR